MELQRKTFMNSLSIVDKVTCKTIAAVNMVVSYPISDTQIEDWTTTIYRLRPNVTLEQLQLVMDKFLDGRTKWDHREGLPNIIRGIDLLQINKGEYLDNDKQLKYRIFGSKDQGNYKRIYENDRDF